MRNWVRILLVIFIYTGTELPAQQLVPFRKGNDWQLYDKSNSKYISGFYQDIVPAKCGILFLKQNDKWGAVSSKNKAVLPFKFAAVAQLNAGVLSARSEKGIQLYDTLGQLISKTYFLSADAFVDDPKLIVCRNNDDKFGIIDSKGQVILKFEYDFAPEHPGRHHIIVGQKAKDGSKEVGLLDSLFRQVLPTEYSKISLLENTYWVVHEINGNYILLDFQKKKLYSGEGEPIKTYTNFMLLRKENSFGIFTRSNGKSFLFTGSFYFRVWDEHGFSAFTDYNTHICHFVNSLGEHTLISNYDVSLGESFTPNFVVATPDDQNKKYGMVDLKGKIIVPLKYDQISSWNNTSFSAGTSSINAQGRNEVSYLLMDIATGEARLPIAYQDIVLFPLGGIALKENGFYHLYDHQMKPQDNNDYVQVRMSARPFLEDIPGRELYMIQAKSSPGKKLVALIDGNCNVVFPPIFSDFKLIKDAYNNPTAFCRIVGTIPDTTSPYAGYGKAILMDRNGKQLSNAKVRTMSYSVNNLILVYADVRIEDEVRTFTGLMDTSGNIVIPPSYDEIRALSAQGGFIFKRNGRVGYADNSGKLLCSLVYDNLYEHQSKFIGGTRNARRGLMNLNGQVVVQFEYEDVLSGPLLNGTLFKVKYDKKEIYVDINGTQYYTP